MIVNQTATKRLPRLITFLCHPFSLEVGEYARQHHQLSRTSEFGIAISKMMEDSFVVNVRDNGDCLAHWVQ